MWFIEIGGSVNTAATSVIGAIVGADCVGAQEDISHIVSRTQLCMLIPKFCADVHCGTVTSIGHGTSHAAGPKAKHLHNLAATTTGPLKSE